MARVRNSMKRQIGQMVKRIVEQFHPEKIILFGSHARGDGTADSDVDLLIVMPVDGSKRAKQLEIRAAVHDVHVAKDIIVSTPEEFQWRKEVCYEVAIPRREVREGRSLLPAVKNVRTAVFVGNA